MYWIQVNETIGIIRRELGERTDITVIEDAGFVILTGEEDVLSSFSSSAMLTVSDEDEGEPILEDAKPDPA